jgi:hypothetical protein
MWREFIQSLRKDCAFAAPAATGALADLEVALAVRLPEELRSLLEWDQERGLRTFCLPSSRLRQSSDQAACPLSFLRMRRLPEAGKAGPDAGGSRRQRDRVGGRASERRRAAMFLPARYAPVLRPGDGLGLAPYLDGVSTPLQAA